MSEPSYRPPLSITLHDVRTGPPHEGERGEGVMLLTDRGNTPAILHALPEAQHRGAAPVVLVGHSFGGAVVIAAGVVHPHVAGVVALAPQTSGAQMAGQLAPRPLLVVHGKADTRLPYACGVHIDDWAQEPKQLILYEGAEHRLDACAAALEQLLTQWIPTTLHAAGASAQEKPSC